MKTIKFKDSTFAPSKVVCIGRNYVEHIHELDNEIPENMVLFNKPNSSITNKLEYFSEDCRFEGEICFLVIDEKLTGIGFGLDLTKANTQNYLKSKGLPWERAKGFNGSCVVGKFIPLQGDIRTLEMKLYVNNTLAQHATYGLMIYKPDEILNEIKTFMSLEDGDIIMSGTPKGVASYKSGDIFDAEIYMDSILILKEVFKVK
ncbi:Fumarylacetoacetate hydrolase [Sulfurovum sp. enrichment culture clone C5]|uniref:Fumarylacetoacetate hydrolase n=1 Tax=Sulfurovum sp. enrichment culture clone C5 TaxID=497650 RepID=A0A0S4XNU6_9BACT|nr:Fumarylacetoacetate hydrolase [Sulfurovum sp. enrichment culture clone C5]